MTEEEPDKDKDRAAKDEEADFNWHRPVGGKENKGVDDTETDSVEIAPGEDDSFS